MKASLITVLEKAGSSNMLALAHQHHTEPEGSAVIPIEDDEALLKLIALFLQAQVSDSNAAWPQQLGWPKELIAEISTMPVADVAKVLSGHNTCVGVVFNHRQVAAVVNAYRARRRDDQELEFFISHGATPSLIHALFPKVSGRILAKQRKRLCGSSKGGRPPLPDADTALEIYRRWLSISTQESSVRRRYILLQEEFPALSMATLSATIEAC
jgi:hypothetical protein